ncbi:MAG: YIP1 family protein [Clostridia bacterium]|nr:YIP1 family protein [Clostridia bacterium]
MNKVNSFFKTLKYSIYVMFHPFKGFWDIKQYNAANCGSATFISLLFALVVIMRCQFTGFIFNYNNVLEVNVFLLFLSVIIPITLWVISNWAITTLVDGEGKMRDIFIATAYSLTPYIIISFGLIILSNFLIADEASFYYLFDTIGIIWSACLLIIGMMTVHQFFFGKTVLTVILAVITMIVIIFMILLFASLMQQIINFVLLLIYEVSQ